MRYEATHCLLCGELCPYVIFALCGRCTDGMTVRQAALLQRALLRDGQIRA